MSICRITKQSLQVGDEGYVYKTARWNGDVAPEGIGEPATVVAVARKYATVQLDVPEGTWNATFQVDRQDGMAKGQRDYRRFYTIEETTKNDRFRRALAVMDHYGLGQANLGGYVELTLEQAEGIARALQEGAEA